MRDLETIRLALTAAETGHLVFGTLHTTSAAKTIDRLVDVFPSAEKAMVRSMLSESLQAVISQTFLKKRRACGRSRDHARHVGNKKPDPRRQNRANVLRNSNRQAIGMKTMDQSLQALVQKHVVSIEVARAKARQPDAITA